MFCWSSFCSVSKIIHEYHIEFNLDDCDFFKSFSMEIMILKSISESKVILKWIVEWPLQDSEFLCLTLNSGDVGGEGYIYNP